MRIQMPVPQPSGAPGNGPLTRKPQETLQIHLHSSKESPVSTDGDDKNIQKRTTTFGSISQAALTGILNPKVAIFFLAFLPQFVRPERGFVLLQFLTLGLILAFIGFVIDCALTFIFHRAGRGFLKNPRFAKWRESVSGAVLIGLGARLALTARN